MRAEMSAVVLPASIGCACGLSAARLGRAKALGVGRLRQGYGELRRSYAKARPQRSEKVGPREQ